MGNLIAVDLGLTQCENFSYNANLVKLQIPEGVIWIIENIFTVFLDQFVLKM